jgi:DNA-binding IclR family transcriptional regulator
MARLTEKSIVDAVEFESEMDRIRGCGHSICDEESEIGAATVAVPIVLPEGMVRSALAVIGPRDRILALAEDGLVEDMARTAAVIAGLEPGTVVDALVPGL